MVHPPLWEGLLHGLAQPGLKIAHAQRVLPVGSVTLSAAHNTHHHSLLSTNALSRVAPIGESRGCHTTASLVDSGIRLAGLSARRGLDGHHGLASDTVGVPRRP